MGLIELDESINTYLPFTVKNPNYPNIEVTIRNLATHTSSLDYNEQVVESLYINEEEKMELLQPFIEDYFVKKKYGEVRYTSHYPGENYNYSNIGAGLAAYIIEYKSGMSYAEFTKTYTFEPLHLNNTFWFRAEADSLQFTKYYEPSTDSIKEVQTSGVILYPCRDLITNIKDLTTYCQSLIARTPKLFGEESFAELLNPQLDKAVLNQSEDNSGLFFQIDRNEYGITYQLTGSTGGDNCINTMMFFDPVTELDYIFIENTGQSEQNRVNHILIYRTLVSLGDNYVLRNPEKVNIGNGHFRYHNYYNRIRAFF